MRISDSGLFLSGFSRTFSAPEVSPEPMYACTMQYTMVSSGSLLLLRSLVPMSMTSRYLLAFRQIFMRRA